MASFSSSAPPQPAVSLTSSEISACRAVKQSLLSRGHAASGICNRAVAITTLNKKLRVEDAVEGYEGLMKELTNYGISGFDEVYAGMKDYESVIAPRLSSYAVCGKDSLGRQIFWIVGGSVQPHEEVAAVRAGWFFFLSVHADDVSLRKGVTFVIDVSRGGGDKKVGNEKKLQRTWQSYPLRPQRILIMGATYIKRLFINGLLKFASLFSKNKVLERVRFATVEEVVAECGERNVPAYISGEGVGMAGDV
eukprot:CAMPEP_0197550502 /NCGR_PEP_ID=MMETSP1320-20131121/4075_1 /TAXON_ID=91990 /ORGANISM="Bolidomonas sp., Strain RCC2347" /LENGTH=249 /DNA_ID=CAMNT_0043110881 /DNA_START=98 /DNA_END=843 /DNA_ORIENTATION=+